MSEPTVSAEFLSGLPKCELHLHLEGTLEPELKLTLAMRNGIDIGQTTVEDVRATYVFDSLAAFLAVYYPAMNVLVTEQDFYDLAHEYFTRAAIDGVRRVEAFFDPQAHTSRGIPIETVIQGYHRAAVDAANFGVSAELILCFLRDFSAESALQTLRDALPYKDQFIGVGLDSDERDNPPAKFAEVFALARAEGLKLTMHCDIDQVGSIENIRQVLDEIKVDRIDHGTNVVESPELVELLRLRQIGLTCCPISNSFVTADMKATEIVDLLHAGVKVTINSDDPAYFGAYVAENYRALADRANLSRDDMILLAKNSFEASWLSDDDKQMYLDEVDAYVAAQS
ncbi:adenosine deaminase [Glaciihabitans tibetensis]|uniref:Adenine deaminase n=1 Tax=Glaciihabitans tibetensis TaxID=1266600 RepID=A0A2T0V495_9MICO|nr:adenosine deaminase [Glaciihabitans tibetensis]PRY65006.1 adenosine deaminase [Glaciihabitans tibetensis]